LENKNLLKKLFVGRKGRQLREYLTAYVFIAPATILIFIFGIFPVGFALYVSLHKWRIKRTDIISTFIIIAFYDNTTFSTIDFVYIPSTKQFDLQLCCNLQSEVALEEVRQSQFNPITSAAHT